MSDGHFFNPFGNLHLADFRADFQNGTGFNRPFDEGAFVGRLDIGRGLVGLHDVDRFVATDGVSGLFQELHQQRFLQSFAQLRNTN